MSKYKVTEKHVRREILSHKNEPAQWWWSNRTHLRYGDPALPGQLFLGLLAGVRIGEVRVKVLVEDFRGLLAEVPALAPGVQEAGAQDHDGLAGGLLQLHLDGAELLVDDLHHALNLLHNNNAHFIIVYCGLCTLDYVLSVC